MHLKIISASKLAPIGVGCGSSRGGIQEVPNGQSDRRCFGVNLWARDGVRDRICRFWKTTVVFPIYANRIKYGLIRDEAKIVRLALQMQDDYCRYELLKGIVRNNWTADTIVTVGMHALNGGNDIKFWELVARKLKAESDHNQNFEYIDPELQKKYPAPMNRIGIVKLLASHKRLFKDCQVIVSATIQNGYWGKDVDMLGELVQSLPLFSYPEAKRHIFDSVQKGCWGDDPGVLSNLAKSLEGLVTDDAQFDNWIDTLKSTCWGKDPRVLTVLVSQIHLANTDERRTKLNNLNVNLTWGTSPEVLDGLALEVEKFSDEWFKRHMRGHIETARSRTNYSVA